MGFSTPRRHANVFRNSTSGPDGKTETHITDISNSANTHGNNDRHFGRIGKRMGRDCVHSKTRRNVENIRRSGVLAKIGGHIRPYLPIEHDSGA